MFNTIKCKHCGKDIEITEAIKHQIKEETKKEVEVDLRKDIEEKSKLETEDLQRALKENDQKMQQMREMELKLREENRKMQTTHQEMELELQRKIDNERKRIEESVSKKISDEFRLKELEKEKVITDLKNALDDMKRKADQGSQQLQGEVLELDLEQLLRETFPYDEISAVGKGIRGADLQHTIRSPKGNSCGVILWECKRTKSWTDEWLSKLKDDLRSTKANIPVIVSTVLPNVAQNGMGLKDGVWVTSYQLVLPLAMLLRKSLFDAAYQKALGEHKGEKTEALYEYVTGHEFRQQVEALVEVYRGMHEQIAKERMAFEKSWKTRDMQIQRLLMSTASIYGSMQGLVGSSMPVVKGLELLEIDGGED